MTLIYEKIDVHGEGEEHHIGGSSQTAAVMSQFSTVCFTRRRADAGGVHQRGQGASRHHGDAHQDDGSHQCLGDHRQWPAEEGHKLSNGHLCEWGRVSFTTDGEPGPVSHHHTKNCTVLD